MAPTIKWQRWESASYDWFAKSTTDALPSLEAELDAWITAVNGNASNAGRSITKKRGAGDSTGGNYAGLVISMGANNNTSKGYFMYACLNSTTSKRLYFGDTYTDDASNGGYGTIYRGYYDTSVSFVTSGQEANWLICSSTVDGQEYFTFGPTFNNKVDSSSQDGFVIFKASDGEWSVSSNDASTSHGHIHYWDDAGGTGWDNCGRNGQGLGSTSRHTQPDDTTKASTYAYGRYSIVATTSSGSSSANVATEGKRVVYAASPDLFQSASTTTYSYTGVRRTMADLGDGDNVYVLSTYFYGPTILVDLRP
jgi:hypothetical protein